MIGPIRFQILFLFLSTVSSMNNPLAGKHLSIMLAESPQIVDATRNATRDVISVTGAATLLLDWLQQDLGFSYSFIREEFVGSKDEATQMAIDKKADVVLGVVFPVKIVYERMDLPAPWFYVEGGIMISIPKPTVNMAALIQPWSQTVWIFYIVSIGSGTISIYIISRVSSKLSKQFGPSPSPKYDFDSFNKILNFSLTSVCSQGAQCPDQRLPIRLAVVSWFIFLLITTFSYSTTLISHVSSPLRRPSINSLQEIPNASSVNILVLKWNAIDDYFMFAEAGTPKKIGDLLKRNDDQRCPTYQDCMKKMAQDPNYVFAHASFFLQILIDRDRKRSGTCNFMLARDNFNFAYVYILLQKDSPYRDLINQGIEKARQSGLLDLWKEWFIPPTKQCQKSFLNIPKNNRLTMKNLLGAFIILIVGYTLALIAFVMEIIMFHCCNKRKHTYVESYSAA